MSISFKLKIATSEAQNRIIVDVNDRTEIALVMQSGGVTDEQSQWVTNQRAQLVTTALGNVTGVSDLQSLRRSDCSGGFSYIQFTLPSLSRDSIFDRETPWPAMLTHEIEMIQVGEGHELAIKVTGTWIKTTGARGKEAEAATKFVAWMVSPEFIPHLPDEATGGQFRYIRTAVAPG